MKKLFLILAALLPITAAAQTLTEASDLNIIGKLIDTPNPYHRVDTVKYKGFTNTENKQVRCASGLAVLFKTDSPYIQLTTEYGYTNFGSLHTGAYSLRGYDLYIKKDGKWLWAAAGVPPLGKEAEPFYLIKDMDSSVKECLLYLPLYSEVRSLKIGTKEGSIIEASESPFRHRVAVFGSSYTHGISTGRDGMAWPAIFTRATGIQMLSIACSGNSKLQPYFANVLADADVEAYVFDGFSNPSPAQMKERLFPFIEQIQAKRPGVPLIFLKTIYREGRNFSTKVEKNEAEKMATADSLMKIAVEKYDNVYYIDKTNATSADHEANIDGIHPSNYGYQLWEKSIEKPLLRILKKYGIK